jgi:competence protein ComEC
MAVLGMLCVPSTAPGVRSIAVAVMLLISAFSSFTLLRAHLRSQPSFPPDATIQAVGVIIEEPASMRGGLRCTMRVLALRAAGDFLAVDFKAAVTVRGARATDIGYGQRILVQGSMDVPAGARNPGEFDTREYLAAMGVTREISVRIPGGLAVLGLEEGRTLYQDAVIGARHAIVGCIDAYVGGEEGELLKGLLLGEKGGLQRETRKAFIVSGVAHVLAVSGSNVAVVAGLALALCRVLRAGRRLRAIAVALAVLWYMALTGAQPPVVRATITALALLAASAREERANPLNALGLSALVLLSVNPLTLFDAGFQLSYGAVIGIVLLSPPLERRIRAVRGSSVAARMFRGALRTGAVSLAATGGTAPFSASFFGSVSLIGLAANMVVVPATGLSVALGMAMALGAPIATWLAASFGALNWLVLRLTLLTARTAAAAPLASVRTGDLGPAETIAIAGILAALASLATGKGVRLVLPFALAALHVPLIQGWISPDEAARRGLRVTFLDVGQGDAALIRTPAGRTILVDAGPATPGFDTGERVVGPYLRHIGVDTIDLMVVTHEHRDHIGGVRAVLAAFPTRRVIIPEGMEAEGLIPPGQVWEPTFAGREESPDPAVRLYVLSPEKGSGNPAGNGNARSVVILVRFAECALLFTGDCEGWAERTFTLRYRGWLRVGAVKVPHHGAKSGAGEDLLEECRPDLAVISVGRRNRFGHPSRELLERLARRQIRTWRTDREGACMLECDGREVSLVPWRNPPLL